MKTITGKIIKILSEQAIILDLGIDNNVSLDDQVHVVSEGEMVSDPDKGTELEKLEYVKAVLRITHVQKKIATCSSEAVLKVNTGTSLYRTVSSDMAEAAMGASPYGNQDSGITVRSSDISGMPTLDPVAVGDTVIVFIQ